MASEHRVVYLTPGQQAPPGSTGIMLSDGGIVWSGTMGSFDPNPAYLGTHLDTDPEFSDTYINSAMTADQMTEYLNILTASGTDGEGI